MSQVEFGPAARGTDSHSTESRGTPVRAISAQLLVAPHELRAAGDLFVTHGDAHRFLIQDVPELKNVREGRYTLSITDEFLRLEQGSLRITLVSLTDTTISAIVEPIRAVGGAVPVILLLLPLQEAGKAEPLRGNPGLLAQDPELREMFRLICVKLGGWPQEMPQADFTPEQLRQSSQLHPNFASLVMAYTQAWLEYRRVESLGVDRFLPMAYRLLEQRIRGNSNALANKLEIASRYHGVGIYLRGQYPFALYNHEGRLMRALDGSTPRDIGFRGELEVFKVEIPRGGFSDWLLKGSVTVTADIDDLAAITYLYECRDVIQREVPRDWPYMAEVTEQVRDQVPSIIAFLTIEALAMIIELVPHPATKIGGFLVTTGVKAAALIRAAITKSAVLFNLIFIGDALVMLAEAGNLLRNVLFKIENGKQVPATALDARYLALAVGKIRSLLVMISSTAAIAGATHLTSGLYSLIGRVPRLKFPGDPPTAVAVTDTGVGRFLVAMPGSTAATSGGPPTPWRRPSSGSLAMMSSVTAGGGGSKSEPSGEQTGGSSSPRRELQWQSHEKHIRETTKKNAERKGYVHISGRTNNTINDEFYEHAKQLALKSPPEERTKRRDAVEKAYERAKGPAKNEGKNTPKGFLQLSVREFLKIINLDQEVKLLERYYALRVKAYTEEVKLRKGDDLGRREAEELLDLFKESQRELNGALKPTMGNKKPDNLEFSKDLQICGLSEATMRCDQTFHLLKSLVDREFTQMMIRNYGIEPREFSIIEYYGNGSVLVPDIGAFKKKLKLYLIGGVKTDFAAPTSEVVQLKADIARQFGKHPPPPQAAPAPQPSRNTP